MLQSKPIFTRSQKQDFITDLIETSQHFSTTQFRDTLIKHIVAAKNNQQSDVFYIATNPNTVRKCESSDIVIYMGGTNLRVWQYDELVKETEFGLIKSGKDFFHSVAKLVEELVEVRDQHFTISLAFPVQKIIRNKYGFVDGEMMPEASSKGHNLDDLIGMGPLGEYFASQFSKSIASIQIENDTIIGLHKSWVNHKDSIYTVDGTGFNGAILDENKNLVNLELARFGDFPIPKVLKAIDPDWAFHPIEKIIAGYGICRLFNPLSEGDLQLHTGQVFQLAGDFDITKIDQNEITTDKQLAQLIISIAFCGLMNVESTLKFYLDPAGTKALTVGYEGSVVDSMMRLYSKIKA
jgi:RNase P/RNase MRP subunit p29